MHALAMRPGMSLGESSHALDRTRGSIPMCVGAAMAAPADDLGLRQTYPPTVLAGTVLGLLTSALQLPMFLQHHCLRAAAVELQPRPSSAPHVAVERHDVDQARFLLAWAWVRSFAHTDSDVWAPVCLRIRPSCWLELFPSLFPNGLNLFLVQKQMPREVREEEGLPRKCALEVMFAPHACPTLDG